MAKPKSLFVCSACGAESTKWNGKCPFCGEWNTLEEQEYVAPAKQKSSFSSGRSTAAASDSQVMRLD